MRAHKITLITAVLIVIFVSSCTKDLNTVPIDPLVTTSGNVFNSPASYEEFLAKLYASIGISGQDITFTEPDIQAADQGTACFMREYWAAEEATTDVSMPGATPAWWNTTVAYGLTRICMYN